MSSHFVPNNDLTEATEGYTALSGSATNEGNGWQSIGNEFCAEEEFGECLYYEVEKFSGSLDGRGDIIDKLTINRPNGYQENA